jgi:hypothetical protein
MAGARKLKDVKPSEGRFSVNAFPAIGNVQNDRMLLSRQLTNSFEVSARAK